MVFLLLNNDPIIGGATTFFCVEGFNQKILNVSRVVTHVITFLQQGFEIIRN